MSDEKPNPTQQMIGLAQQLLGNTYLQWNMENAQLALIKRHDTVMAFDKNKPLEDIKVFQKNAMLALASNDWEACFQYGNELFHHTTGKLRGKKLERGLDQKIRIKDAAENREYDKYVDLCYTFHLSLANKIYMEKVDMPLDLYGKSKSDLARARAFEGQGELGKALEINRMVVHKIALEGILDYKGHNIKSLVDPYAILGRSAFRPKKP